MASARAETRAVPAAVREQVFIRDGGCCRMCGATVKEPALHHIVYRSEGGRNVVENLITVHWMYAPRCHEVIHSNKRLWQPILLVVAQHDGINARQLLRWMRAKQVGAGGPALPRRPLRD